jgi:D-aspartate ligase
MSGWPSVENAACAVVAGLDLNGLGVARSLARAGVRFIALDTELNKPTTATRYGTKLRVSALSGPSFVEDLLGLRARFKSNPVLLLTQEQSVATVSAERERLARAYRFTMPNHSLMEDLLDKLRFQSLAERHGFPIPRAVRLVRGHSTDTVGHLRYPCVLKPTTKHPEYSKRFAKAYKVARADEVRQLWSGMHDVIDEMIVQEWIEGGDSDVYFCLWYRPSAERPSTSFVGRKICQWPILVGGTASCMPAPEATAELTTLTDRFFSTVGFTGIGSIEYKRDARDGRFYMIEPTVGRTDYQEEIATLNGVNIPVALYWGELGLNMPPSRTAPPARAWRDPLGYSRARMAGAPDPMFEISPNIKVYDAYLRIDDPMPFIALKMQSVRSRLSRIWFTVRPRPNLVSHIKP